MKNNKDDDLYIVTEVGTFGDIDIDDPTVMKVKKKKKSELDEIIEQAIKENEENLKNK